MNTLNIIKKIFKKNKDTVEQNGHVQGGRMEELRVFRIFLGSKDRLCSLKDRNDGGGRVGSREWRECVCVCVWGHLLHSTVS